MKETTEIITDWRVRHLLWDVGNKANPITISVISKELGISDRSIQKKIKQLGYIWKGSQGYVYVGADPEQQDIDFRSLFDKNAPKKVKRKPVEAESTTIQNGEASIKKVIPKEKASDYDEIDMLLEKKTVAKKVYRGFYFEEDVLAIIDSVGDKQKSKLVNAALRKVFTEKGYL